MVKSMVHLVNKLREKDFEDFAIEAEIKLIEELLEKKDRRILKYMKGKDDVVPDTIHA